MLGCSLDDMTRLLDVPHSTVAYRLRRLQQLYGDSLQRALLRSAFVSGHMRFDPIDLADLHLVDIGTIDDGALLDALFQSEAIQR